MWMVGSATSTRAAPGTFVGDLYTGTGPPFSAFVPSAVKPLKVGAVTITFTGRDNASLSYTVNGASVVKSITRELLDGALAFPTCVWGENLSQRLATNLTDLWWNPAEPGWGLNLTHQGDTVYGSWFTFDRDGKQLWLVVAANKTAPGIYEGALLKAVSGPPFNEVPFVSAKVKGAAAGTATLAVSDGNNVAFTYTVDGVTQTKLVTREVFNPPGTVCY